MNSKELLAIADKIHVNYESKTTQKALDYLDGRQLKHVIDTLNDPNKGRANWNTRGFMPLYRNLTKSVIEKSGLVYVHGMPHFECWVNGAMDDTVTEMLYDYAYASDLSEFLINLDDCVRLLKSVAILTDYNSETDSFSFNMLHRGNAAVIKQPGSSQIDYLVYCVESSDEGVYHYRVISPFTYEDWVVKAVQVNHNGMLTVSNQGGSAEKVNEVPNPYGFVPVTMYHDTNIPRSGVWNPLQLDLVTFNEMYNMWMTDVTFTSSWSLRPTLYTNAVLGDARVVENEYRDDASTTAKLLGIRSDKNQSIAGPDQVVNIDTQGVDSPFIDYKGPTFQLEQLQNLWNTFSTNIASDWSVNLDMKGYGDAKSGFQIVVQEIPNLQLRQKRTRMAERGLKRLINTMFTMVATVGGKNVPDFETYITFPEPSLPVDPMAETEHWVLKIENGLASREMYFEEVHKMSEEEAVETVLEIDMAAQNKTPPESDQETVTEEVVQQ